MPLDEQMIGIMTGAAYQDINTHSDTDESPCPSPDGNEKEQPSPNRKLFDPGYAGCAKKSAVFPKLSMQKRKRLLSLNSRERDKSLRKHKYKVTPFMLNLVLLY